MATKYSDIVTIRQQQAAYDIAGEREGDWTSFMPNDQFNDILRKVISSVRNNDADLHKSFWISGTYGTGKSHAGAVLKHLLCDSVDDINNYVNDEYADERFAILKQDIFSLREKKRLFPITMYGQALIAHKEDLSLQLQKKITQTLQAAGINITVQTDFDNYINHIEKNPEYWDLLLNSSPKLKSTTPDRKQLVASLKSGDCTILTKVRDAWRASGMDIRLDLENLPQWFFEVQRQLREQTEYDGLLVIWDEFTDLMTSDIGVSLLVALQEVNEKVMNSDNDSYFLFISHPSALNNLDAAEREKTKGRYHYMSYNMEPMSAFKIMSRKFKPVKSEKEYAQLYDRFYDGKSDLLNIYAQASNDPEDMRRDLKRLFPLHPSTANLAAYYAREAGSSSRSVFQFIGENEAIRLFLDTIEHYKNLNTITADYLWDYVVDEFNDNVTKYGAVTERYNSRNQQVAHEGAEYLAVFKGILLLNALNNIANNETVTPSEDNIRYMFEGTHIAPMLDEILDYFDANGIIQRQPGGLFSIQFSALPTKEIADIKEEMRLNQFKYTYKVVELGETARKEIDKLLSGVARAKQYGLFSEDANDYTLQDKIARGAEAAHPYELYLAILVSRNHNELTHLREFAQKYAQEEKFANVAFLVFDGTFSDKNYERFIEYVSNAECARRHGFADQKQTHDKCAQDMIKEWMGEIRRGNFTCYIRESSVVGVASKMATMVNSAIAPVIFEHGPESLEIIQTKYSQTYWKQASVKQMVDAILSYNTRTDVLAKCNGPYMHMTYLLQDSVDENLEWKSDVDPNHPMKLVSDFIDKKFKHTDKNQPFNMGDKLIDLTKPPFGLYQTVAGMGMVALSMRKYIKQIFDLNGKPREAQHIVDDIVEMFKAWDAGKSSNKLQFRFETKETRNLCNELIALFDLNKLPGYHDISSLVDARWAITHEFAKQKEFPLWSLKYVAGGVPVKIPERTPILIDNILKVCNASDMRDPALITDTLKDIEAYKFEVKELLKTDGTNYFKAGFMNFMKQVEVVNMQTAEFDEAFEYIKQHMQETVGLWSERDVADKLKNWRMSTTTHGSTPTANEGPVISPIPPKVPQSPAVTTKRTTAKSKVQKIKNAQKAVTLLEQICESAGEDILDIINDYDV